MSSETMGEGSDISTSGIADLTIDPAAQMTDAGGAGRWPWPLGITEIELEVVTRALAEEFISLEVEEMGTTEPNHVGSTAQA
ncbi:hypothetical protein [Pseudomonas sp. MF6396]|nr:hypothetical protein [Pseudomonas sp. MF6396]